jgi:hypothetical protein
MKLVVPFKAAVNNLQSMVSKPKTTPMTKFKFFSLLSSAAVAVLLVSPAYATTVTIGGYDTWLDGEMSSVHGAHTVTFNNLSVLPAGFTATGTSPAIPLVQGTRDYVYAAPTGDFSTYLTTGSGTITDTLSAGVNYFGFYWGSIDSYNTFSISESNGTTFSITGTELANEFDLTYGDSYFVNFFAGPNTSFRSATFASASPSFEFDNVATATPEPGTVSMLAGGLLIFAGAFRRRRKP